MQTNRSVLKDTPEPYTNGDTVGMASSISFPSRFTFFDRDACLSMHTILEWCQESRVCLINEHPTFLKWKNDLGYNFVVKAQMGRFIRKVQYSLPVKIFRVDQYFEQIGKTSFRFSYIIYENDELIARAICAIVNTEYSTSTGIRSPSSLPPYMVNEITWSEKDPEGSKFLTNIPKALSVSSTSASVTIKKPSADGAHVSSLPVYPIIVRYSDEDVNYHTNQASYVKFIEDHLTSSKVPGVMALWIEYIAETHADDKLEVRFTAVGQEFGSAVEIVRVGKYQSDKNEKEVIVCRAWCAHDVSHLLAISTSDIFLEQTSFSSASASSSSPSKR